MDSIRWDYLTLLTAYRERFNDVPPTILSEEGAVTLMARALRRGRPITAGDMGPLEHGVAEIERRCA